MILKDICEVYSGYALKDFNETNEGFPVIKIGNICNDGSLELDSCQYSKQPVNEKFYSKQNDIYVALSGATTGKIAMLESSDKYIINQRVGIVRKFDDGIPYDYIKYFLLNKTKKILQDAAGCAQPNISPKQIGQYELPSIKNTDMQYQADILNIISQIINLRKNEIEQLDYLIKARFVEMFGDLKSNSKGWKIVRFNDCAKIDTNMIREFKDYQDYPHIGIDCIEKETGRLIGYKTVLEDGVISGKYLFTPKHIIYSKIRPNLNKVALPNFSGLCSADAYPILVKEEICNREFLGYTLRSQFFLDYILNFSNRTNLPKVNKNQVEGFTLPLPPIEVQKQFSEFVKQVDKSKVELQKSLEQTQILFNSLMQKYFG